MEKATKPVRQVIGRLDLVDLPEFHLFEIPCKIDTGARTSAIHCKDVELITKDGIEYISFKLLDPSHDAYNGKTFMSKSFEEKLIKSSFGNVEKRYVIQSSIVVFGETYVTNFTLSDREQMKFPLLIGRKLLHKNFIVDVAKVNLSHKKKLKKVK